MFVSVRVWCVCVWCVECVWYREPIFWVAKVVRMHSHLLTITHSLKTKTAYIQFMYVHIVTHTQTYRIGGSEPQTGRGSQETGGREGEMAGRDSCQTLRQRLSRSPTNTHTH